jgi:replicative DNA helicase
MGLRLTSVAIPTGFADLDKITGGLHKGDLILVAARPAMGKTTFALNIAANAAISHKIPVVIFSAEAPKKHLLDKLIANVGTVELSSLKKNKFADNEFKFTDNESNKIACTLKSISDAPIHFKCSAAPSVSEVRAKCCKLKQDKGLGLVIIDYFQLMDGDDKGCSRQKMSEILSRSLKALAMELECPIIVISQLSRAPDIRNDHRPILSDLKESSAIAQDADMVWFLYREKYYDPDTDKKDIAEVIIAKQRNGTTDKVELRFQGKYGRFENLEITEQSREDEFKQLDADLTALFGKDGYIYE